MEILKASEVARITTLSRPTIYRLIEQGRFPRPLQLSNQAVGWRKNEIEDWLETRPRAGGRVGLR